MPPIAYFGIESSGLSLAIDLLILFLVVLYGALVYWTYADARRRIADPMLVGCATFASLFPFVGTIVYMILRPPEYLEDVRERELELQAAEARLHELDHSLCPHCDYHIERDFIRCPSCLRKLKERCTNCAKPLDRAWTICPYCETEVPDAKPARRTRRERTTTGEPTSRTRPDADIDTEAKPSRSRTGERAAVRAPDTAALLSERAPRPSEPASTGESDLAENGNPDASEPKVRSRGSSRPRSK
ncbi:MAG TPA: zinc ribbon domain-containing protein [Solirubrobacteraceae bacterium]|jgi:RNA polymerase subunit RPABC4/transcription elongation factor Spt4